jgi:hypothetical protein
MWTLDPHDTRAPKGSFRFQLPLHSLKRKAAMNLVTLVEGERRIATRCRLLR